MTVGLVGFGQIGREVAKRLRGFDVKIIYYDAERVPVAVEEEDQASFVSLDELIANSDVVSLHVPLFPETRHLINAERIASMKPGSILINCARGPIVDEAALVEALKTKHLLGAGLDCFDSETPGGTAAFWPLQNVVLSPHMAGATIDNFAEGMQRGFANAQKYAAGEELPSTDVLWIPEVRRGQ